VADNERSLYAGVDLGGTKIETVVLKGGKVAGSDRVQTPRTGAEDVIEAIAQSVRSALESAKASAQDLAAVGVGSPGVIGQDGSVGSAKNVPGFEGAPVAVASELTKKLGANEIKVDNDVRVAVRGEWKRGAGRPYTDMLGVFVGTGVGGGLVLDNKLLLGRGAAGEIGHTLVREGGRVCSCGMEGHLESYAGRGRMEARARHLHERGEKTELFELMRKRGRDRITSGVIHAAIERDDKMAKKFIDEAVWALGIALANAQNLLDLEAIIVGGGLGDRLGQPFVSRIEEAVRDRLFVPDKAPRFLTTELGDLSGAVGAAVLAGG
jgi:glucokinase